MKVTNKKKSQPLEPEANHPGRENSEAETKYRVLFEQSPDGILIIDTDGKILDFNEAAHRQLGFTREEFAGFKISDIDITESPEDTRKRIETLLKNGSAEFDVRHRTKDGKIKDVHVITRTIVLSGRPVFHTIFRDITAQKRTEQLIRQSEEKFRTLFESATDALFILSPEGKFLDVNRTAHERLGYTKEEMLSLCLSQLDPPEFAARVSERLQHVMKHGHAIIESAHRRKDGTVMPVEINTRVIDYDGGKAIFSIIRDITDRKRAEEELKELNARLQALIHAIPDLVAFKDTGGRHLVVNRALEEFTGLRQDELIGRTNADLLPPELLESCDKSDEEVLRSLMPVHYEEHYAGEGGKKRYFDTVKAPIFDGPDDVAGIVTVSREITDRKKIEEQIRASLDEKEILLKEIHHRVKNNLNVIASLLNLQMRCITDTRLVDIFHDCQNRIRSMALIHEKLYAKGDLLEVNIKEYVVSLISSLSSLYLGDKNNVVFRTDVRDISLDIDTSIPCGLIVNELVTNSIKHAFSGRGSGQIHIAFYPDGRNYTLSVKDDGVGLQKDFDLAGSETLGLQLVQVLTQQLGGTLKVIVDGGTEFRITFDGQASGPEI